ncbi:MAG TPA: LysR family transcriptional regulator [Pararobbsia sp.]|nr:LysR family transcriptional regulator [Pararobbsia sp.]
MTYIAVVETGSLTRAAKRLGVGKTSVSRAIQRLERQLGASLIVRTTRSISVTEAGTSFFETCCKIVHQFDDVMSVVRPASDDLRGTLRVAATVEYSAIVLAPVLLRMRAQHPALRIEIVSGDRCIDLVAEGIDVAIRLGELANSSYRAVPLASYSRWLVASPRFVERNPLPSDPRDATRVAFVGLSVLPHPSRCLLRRDDGTSRDLEFMTDVVADTVYACRAIAGEGAGLAFLPDFAVRADIASGRLVRVFPEWSSGAKRIHALLPPARHAQPKARALIDMLRTVYAPATVA